MDRSRARSISVAVASLMVAFLLSGCAGAPSTNALVPSESDALPVAPRADFGEGEGGIEGHVVDNSFLPIVAAVVRLLPVGAGDEELASFTTPLDGGFAFSNLQPGEYRLSAVASGFANRTELVTVEEGRVNDASIILEEIPGIDPYATLYIRNGIQGCAHSFFGGDLNSLGPLANTCAQLTEKRVLSMGVNVSAGHQAIVFEADWPEGSVSAAWDVYSQHDNETGWLNSGYVTPPVHTLVRQGETTPGQTLTGIPFDPVPASEVPFRFIGQVVYGGDHAETIDQVGGPVCDALEGCGGAGFQLQWRFTMYTTVFMNEAPTSLDVYSALPDQ